MRAVIGSVRLWVPVLLLGGIGALALRLGVGRSEHSGKSLSVVLVLADTLRADHLGAYGYHRDTSPAIDAFAELGVLFENARSQSACTFPSVNSLLTSRYPLTFLGQPRGSIGIPQEIPSLPEILARYGYRTAIVSASPVVRQTPSRFNPQGGFDRGFHIFDESCESDDAECVNRRALHYLDELEAAQPFLLYLHYYDPHAPYRPPSSHRRRFAREYDGKVRFVRRGDPYPIARRLYEKEQPFPIAKEDLGHLIALYDDEIAYFDDQFSALRSELATRGLLERTIVVVLSDHGEAFLEHGHINHCRTLYDTQIKVPLSMWIPGAGNGVRVSSPVANLDLVPTLLDYLEIPHDGSTFQGRSLRALIENADSGSDPSGSEPLRYAFAQQGSLRTVNDARFKLLYELETRKLELYDLEIDPGELDDVSGRFSDHLHRLEGVLFDWLLTHEGDVASRRSIEAGEQATERLRALGYLQ